MVKSCLRAVPIRAALLGLSFCFICPHLFAQKFFKGPEVDVFGGYSYLRFQGSSLGFPGALNLNGGDVEVSLPHVFRGLGVVADISGHYSSELQEYNFLIGAQYRFELSGLHFYAHGLGGRSRTRLGQIGLSQIEPSSPGAAGMFGGGVELPWKEKISIRPVQVDYLINGAFGDRFKSIRVSTGVVFQFGKRPAPAPGL